MTAQLVVDVGHHRVTALGRRTPGSTAVTASAGTRVWMGRDGGVLRGDAARRRAQEAPEQGLTGWLERVGDPVPLHTASGTVTGAQLLAAVLEEVLGDLVARTGPLQGTVEAGLLVPDDWQPRRILETRVALTEQLEALTGAEVRARTVPSGEALLAAPVLDDVPETGAALVLDVGAGRVRARVVEREEKEGTHLGPTVTEPDLGGAGLDHLVLADLVARLPQDRLPGPGTDEHLRALCLLRDSCREAREELSVAVESVVELPEGPGGRTSRLVRPELEELTEGVLTRILDVGHRAVDAWAAARPVTLGEDLGPTGLPTVSSVVLLGGVARMPRLVQRASAEWMVPAVRPEEPQLNLLRGALEVCSRESAARAWPSSSAGWPAAPAAPEQEGLQHGGRESTGPGNPGQDPQPLSPFAPPAPHGDHGAHGDDRTAALQVPLLRPVTTGTTPVASDRTQAGPVRSVALLDEPLPVVHAPVGGPVLRTPVPARTAMSPATRPSTTTRPSTATRPSTTTRPARRPATRGRPLRLALAGFLLVLTLAVVAASLLELWPARWGGDEAPPTVTVVEVWVDAPTEGSGQ